MYSKDTENLNNAIKKLDLFDVYRLLHSKKAEHKLFLSSHKTFIKMDHIKDHKIHFNKYKSIEGM